MKKIVVLFLLLLSFQLFGELPTVAVYHFQNETTQGKFRLSDNTLELLEEKLRSELIKTKKFQVMSADTMEAAIAQHKKKSHQLNYDRNYQIELGKTIFARYIVIGKIKNDGGDYTIFAEMINTETSVSTGAGNADFTAPKASRDKAAISIIKQLLGEEDEEIMSARPKKSDDQLACEKARSLRDAAGWIAYKKRYPDGICIEEADRELDKMGCELAKNRNTVEDWEKYLDRHPKGICSMDAEIAILRLKRQEKAGNGGNSGSNSGFSGSNNGSTRDAKACEYAKNENSVEAWQDYLDTFPDGDCSFEAKGNIRKLKKEREEQERKAAYLKGRKIGNLIWSDRSASEMNWSSAKQYCEDLTEGGYTDWRLPNIDELRTLLIADRVSNRCRVSERNNCLSDDCWSCSTCTQTGTQKSDSRGCSDWGTAYSDGRYSRLGDGKVWLWSSSTFSDDTGYAWYVNFKDGRVNNYVKSNDYYVRCVR